MGKDLCPGWQGAGTKIMFAVIFLILAKQRFRAGHSAATFRGKDECLQ